MATTIQIKRSPNVAAATTTDLIEGELAYSYDKSSDGAGAKLYIKYKITLVMNTFIPLGVNTIPQK
jgi:two-component sensor histidine kinase